MFENRCEWIVRKEGGVEVRYVRFVDDCVVCGVLGRL